MSLINATRIKMYLMYNSLPSFEKKSNEAGGP